MHNECFHCKPHRVVENVKAVDHSDHGQKEDMSIELYEYPYSEEPKKTHRINLHASVCLDCGYVMFYGNVNKIRRAVHMNPLPDKTS